MSIAKRRPLACFIHSTNLHLLRETVLLDLLDKIKKCGLLYRLDHLCIINTGEDINQSLIESTYAPAKVINWSDKTNEFEICTIKQVVTYSRLNPDALILYMHTKGVSYKKDHVFTPGIRAWINYMTYCLLDNYVRCLSLLQVYDTVGCNYRPDEDGNMQHYSGNFWWARADYLQNLLISKMKDKYEPEFWILQKQPFLFNIHTIEHMYEQSYPICNYKECVDRGFSDNIFFCKIGFHQSGFCNQMYNLINCIVVASVQSGNKVIVVDDFITQVMTTFPKPADQVIDMVKLNEILKPYKIHVFYKNDIKMELLKVEYGLKHIKLENITDAVINNFWTTNRLYIPRGYQLNQLVKEDPCPQMRKQIYVYYTINGVPLMKTYHERILSTKMPIVLHHQNYDEKWSYFVNLPHEQPWLTLINRDCSKDLRNLFDDFIPRIPFLSMYHEMAQKFIEDQKKINGNSDSNINIIHIRNESDAVTNWARINRMEEKDYEYTYNTKMKKLIMENTSKCDLTVALTDRTTNNPIIDDLNKEGFNIITRPNIENIGREMNALIDLLLCYHCTKTFIGCFDEKTKQGSTFSFYIYNLLKNKKINSVILNIENINK